jgi:hypothetical protein
MSRRRKERRGISRRGMSRRQRCCRSMEKSPSYPYPLFMSVRSVQVPAQCQYSFTCPCPSTFPCHISFFPSLFLKSGQLLKAIFKKCLVVLRKHKIYSQELKKARGSNEPLKFFCDLWKYQTMDYQTNFFWAVRQSEYWLLGRWKGKTFEQSDSKRKLLEEKKIKVVQFFLSHFSHNLSSVYLTRLTYISDK